MTAVDTVIVAYDSEDVIERALTRARRLGGRTVVVDHGDGGSARVAAARGALAVHDPSNPGFGAGQNHGVAFTDSELVLLCNPDAEIDPDAVLAGTELLRSRTGVAAVQGVIVNRSTGRPERSAGVELGPVHLVGRALGARALLGLPGVGSLARRSSALRDHADRVPPGPAEVDTLAATAVLVRRSALESVGGFDEDYFLYGEDLDLCRRLRLLGWKLVTVPDVWATHTSGGSTPSAWAREASWWRGTLQFAARWWGSAAWSLAVAAAVARWARLSARHPARVGAAWATMVTDPLDERARPRSTGGRPCGSVASR
jgi:GT2 family glycosyltransferase